MSVFGSRRRRFLGAFAASVLLAACAAAPVVPAGGIQETKILAWQWNYEPAVVIAKAGYPIRWTVESIDTRHTLTNDELGVDIQIPPRHEGPVIAEFTVSRPGTWEFRSTAPTGPGVGRQKLKLIVTR